MLAPYLHDPKSGPSQIKRLFQGSLAGCNIRSIRWEHFLSDLFQLKYKVDLEGGFSPHLSAYISSSMKWKRESSLYRWVGQGSHEISVPRPVCAWGGSELPGQSGVETGVQATAFRGFLGAWPHLKKMILPARSYSCFSCFYLKQQFWISSMSLLISGQ